MASPSSQTLRFPGGEARELWTRDGNGPWKKAAADNGGKGGTLVLEALATDSAPFWAQTAPDGSIDLESVASLHWEGLGLETEGGGQGWIHWRVCEEAGRVLVGTMALVPEATPKECIDFMPDRFEPSARLVPIPSGECAVWQELGRYVVAFTRGSHLLHVNVLNARVLDAAAAHEIHDLSMALDVRGLLAALAGCRVWTDAGDEFTSTVKSLLGVKVRVESKPAPQLSAEGSGLMPPEVEIRREEVFRRGQTMWFVLTALLGCAAFFLAWGGWLALREKRVQGNLAALRAQESQLQAVRDARLHWSAVEAATNPDVYPVEVFHQVLALLPPEGIQLKEFVFDEGKLVVLGEASTTAHALKFMADIEHNEALKRYTWNNRQPDILEGDRAKFRAEGSLGGGTEGDLNSGGIIP